MENKRLLKFLSITFAVSFPAWILLAVLIKSGVLLPADPICTVLHIIGGFGPTIAALFTTEEKLTAKSFLKFVFSHKKNSMLHPAILAVMTAAVFGFLSMELNPNLPLYLIPVVFLQVASIYGGAEELGWRGIMQPILEKKFSFPAATLITGIIWGIWHIPLWFIDGTSQQNMSFPFFLIICVILSFLLAAVYKRTKCVFCCMLFHGLINTLFSVFVIEVNFMLATGLIIPFAYSVYLWYCEDKKSDI